MLDSTGMLVRQPESMLKAIEQVVCGRDYNTPSTEFVLRFW
jgi:hypothetical protein